MSEPRDPLRDLWDAIEAPPAHRALADEDAATRAAVDWLQRALAQVRPTAAAPVTAMRLIPARRWPLRFALTAAAAALLLLARVFMRETEPAALLTTADARPAADTVELLANDAQHLEMRSGSVRLTLLQPQPRKNS